MHLSNVWSAWTIRSQQALESALPPERSFRDLAALTLIESHPGESVDWLRQRVLLTQSGTVRLLDRLEHAGLIERGERLGRNATLHITQAGRDLLRAWYQAREAAFRSVFASLSPEEQTIAVTFMETMLKGEPRVRAEADHLCSTCDWDGCETCPVHQSVPV